MSEGRQEKKHNILKVNYVLYELATEYGIKNYEITSNWIGGIYRATLRWHHKAKGEMINLSLAITKDTLDAEEYTEEYRRYEQILELRQRQFRQGFVDIIMEFGSAQ